MVEQETSENNKKALGWLIFSFIGLFLSVIFVFFAIHLVSGTEWIIKLIQEHFAAIVLVPLGQMAALCIVLLLKVSTSGAIKFQFLTFKFRGASGPIILWVLCFFSVIAGTKILW